MNTRYEAFLASKRKRSGDFGRDVDVADVNPMLHDWQKEVVQWAVRKGRAAIWEDCGLGKTFQSLEWARLSADTSLIVTPLAVSAQTVREAAKLGINATYVRSGDQITGPGVWVTNYEMVDRFDPSMIGAVVLDESSILKAFTGKVRTKLISHFKGVPHRLSCTATPAPNDPEELTSQAEFLGVCSRVDMLASYFIHDDVGWRLKGHAAGPMYQWMSTWAMALRKPSDLGYPDDGYELPELRVIPHVVHVGIEAEGQLFATDLGGVGGRARVRRQTLDTRCDAALGLVATEPGEQWILWTALNAEADRLAKGLPGAVNVHGSMKPEGKAEALLAFADGDIPVLVSKSSIAGHGMNFQNCARMAFVGMNDSFESHYQATRRCWRYGQTRRVDSHIIVSELESQIAHNVTRKERAAATTIDGLIRAMRQSREAA